MLPKYGQLNHVSLADLVQPHAHWHVVFTRKILLSCSNEVCALKDPLFIELKRVSPELGEKVSVYYETECVFIIPWRELDIA